MRPSNDEVSKMYEAKIYKRKRKMRGCIYECCMWLNYLVENGVMVKNTLEFKSLVVLHVMSLVESLILGISCGASLCH